MDTLPYIFKSTAILVVLLIYYSLFLKKRTFFHLNRIYLLSTLLTAFCFPFLHISASLFTLSATQNMLSIQSLTYWLDEVIVQPASDPQNIPLSYSDYLKFFYWLGVGIVLLFTLGSLLRLKKFIHTCPHKKYRKLHFIEIKGYCPTFSFFNYLFINDYGLTRDNKHKIYEHEKIHIRQLHSADLLLAQSICILNWYNPLFWYLKQLISENHEYIADEYVIKKFRPESYLQLLINQTFRKKAPLTHCFSCSNLKKRALRIMTPPSAPGSRYLYLPVFLLVGLLFVAFACHFSWQEENVKKEQPDPEEVFEVVETMPIFQGNLSQWIDKNKRYPLEAQRKKIQGEVLLQFVIDKKGKVQNPKILQSSHPLLDAEALRLAGIMPDWKTGLQRGKPVKVAYRLPIAFQLEEEEEVFEAVEKMPYFKEGNLRDWLIKQTQYPQEAIDARQEAKIHVAFIIEKDGSISNVHILKSGKIPSLEREALRVIKKMPAWAPGTQDGKNVRVKYAIPFTFQLSNK